MAKRGVYPQRVCVACGEKFQGPKGVSYLCKAGGDDEKHEVESKTYFCPTQGLAVNWKKDVIGKDVMGNASVVASGRAINFAKGMFSTTDPEEQDYLDNYKGVVSFEEWERINVSEKLRAERSLRLAKAAQEELAGRNEELEKLKKQLAEAEAKLAKKG